MKIICYFMCLFASVSLVSCSLNYSSAARDQNLTLHLEEEPKSVMTQLTAFELRLQWMAAHRGGINFGPENSLQAIGAAAREGVPLIEIDLRKDARGELFLFHDRRLKAENFANPHSWVGRPVEELTAAERQQISLLGGSKETIPTFREVLIMLQPSETVLLLDLKGESIELARTVVSEVGQHAAQNRVVLQFTKQEVFEYVRKNFPDIKTLKACRSLPEIDQALSFGVTIVELADRKLIADAPRLVRNRSRILFDVSGSSEDTLEIREGLFRQQIDIVMTDHALGVRRVAAGKSAD